MTDPRVSDRSEARQAAIAMYYATYSHYAESAQLYAGTNLGFTVASTAMLFLVAADAEENDPEPSVTRNCCCASCLMYRLLGDKSMPAMERMLA
jgi:hypothetical protein